MDNVPAEVRKEHMAVCEKCDLRKKYARKFDVHFDWIDCPYVCGNDYETWRKQRKDDAE